MVIQNEKLKSFLAQAITSSGKGPSCMTSDKADRNIQIHTAKVNPAEFANKKARQEAREENKNPQVFVPTRQWCVAQTLQEEEHSRVIYKATVV